MHIKFDFFKNKKAVHKKNHDIFDGLNAENISEFLMKLLSTIDTVFSENKIPCFLTLNNLNWDPESFNVTFKSSKGFEKKYSSTTWPVGDIESMAPEMLTLICYQNPIKASVAINESLALYSLGIVLLQVLTKNSHANLFPQKYLLRELFSDEKLNKMSFHFLDNISISNDYAFDDFQKGMLRELIWDLTESNPKDRISLNDVKVRLGIIFPVLDSEQNNVCSLSLATR